MRLLMSNPVYKTLPVHSFTHTEENKMENKNINLDNIVDSFEFNTDSSKDEQRCPVIDRNSIKEYLLQLRAMEGYELAAFVDMLPESRTSSDILGVISGGRNAQVKRDDDGAIDFKLCPFHIRFTTEYGGQWFPGAPEKLKRDMTRKFMDEPLKGTSLSQPRTALDYLYMTSVGSNLTPEVTEFICKNRYSKEEAAKAKGVAKPAYNVYLSYHNISANTDEQVLNFHKKVRLDIAEACYKQMGTKPFELHIVGIVTGMAVQESKQEGVSHGVHITVPAFLVYVRPLECSKFSSHSAKDFKKNLAALKRISGIPAKTIAQRFEVREEDLPTLFQKYDPGFNISSVTTVPTYGTKRGNADTVVKPAAPVKPTTAPVKPVKSTTPTNPEVESKSTEPIKPASSTPTVETTARKPSTSEKLKGRRASTSKASEPIKTESPTTTEVKPSTPLEALAKATGETIVLGVKVAEGVDLDGGLSADETPEVKPGGLF